MAAFLLSNLDLGIARVIIHDSSAIVAALRSCCRIGLLISERFRTTAVGIDGALVHHEVRAFSPAEGVLALSLHCQELRRATLTRGILVRLPRLHHVLHGFALLGELLHCFVLLCESLLKIIDHAGFNLLELLDAIFISFFDSGKLLSSMIVSVRHTLVVGVPSELIVLLHIFAVVEAVCRPIIAILLLFVFLTLALVLNFLRLHAEHGTRPRIVVIDLVLV